jgi:hypothetical protein
MTRENATMKGGTIFKTIAVGVSFNSGAYRTYNTAASSNFANVIPAPSWLTL